MKGVETMHEIVIRLKSGREFQFKCEEYTIETFKMDGTLSEFSYKGGVGECPIYLQEQDIECIVIIRKEREEKFEQVPNEDCIDRYSALAELDPLSYEYKTIKELPSVVPSIEPKSGKWRDIATELDASFKRHDFVCSECAHTANYFVGGSEDWWDMEKPNYCPNCGAKMKG